MNKIIVSLLLITPFFTYGMEELALVCTMKEEKRQCTNAFFSEKSFSIQDFKGQEERPENIEESQSYHIFFKKIDERREYPLIEIPLASAPPLRAETGFSYYLNVTGFPESYEETATGNICTITKRNFKQSIPKLDRYANHIQKRLNETKLSCYNPNLKD